MLVVLVVVIRTQGFVKGYEFSPTHFQKREFSFYEIPLIHLQITPIKRLAVTPSTATYVRQNALITPHTGVPTVWHLVSLSRGLTGSTPADAKLLLDQLELLDHGGDDYWIQWSKKDPKQAKVLWPFIQRLAERELYVFLPELFELAQIDSESPNQLRQSIDRYLLREYALLIEDMRASGRTELAEQLLTEARTDYPNDPALIQLNRAQ